VTKSAKKRVGRPPGRTAPHRPVLSQRVPQALYDMIKEAARTAGRTMGEEMVWRVERSFEWEAAFKSIPALQGEARDVLEELLARAAAQGVRLAFQGEGGLRASAEIQRHKEGEQP
jgi:Arc-like DNA binding dprotein